MTHQDNLNFSPTADTRALWIDRSLLGLSAIALCLVVYLLATDFSFYSFQNANLAKYKTVAIATETKLNVRKRTANLPIWDRVRDGDQLNNRDQIFTDKDSSTVLEFLDGSRIRLGENTLIKVQKGESRTSFDVLQGDFVAEGGDGSIPVEINFQGVRTVLSGKNSAIKVKTDREGKTSITVVGGKAQILAKGKTVEVGPNQQGQFARDGTLTEIRKIPFVLLNPRDSEEFFLHKKSRTSRKSVEFSWEPVKGVKLYRLEVAKDSEFKKVIYRDTYDLPLAFVDLRLGSYYWRISSVNKITRKREFSVDRTIQVVKDVAPALMLPQAGETFRYREVLETKGKKAGALVRFSWTPVVTERYEIEIARDASFQQSISRLQLALPFHVMTGLEGGEYHWRVRNVSWKRPDSPWSASRSFWVEEIPLPRVLASKPKPVVFVPSHKKPVVSVDWPKVALAKEYVIEISRQANFSSTIQKETVRSPILDWKPKELGEYFWRVKPVDVYGRKTRYGPTRKLTVVVTASDLLYPKPKAFLSLPDLHGRLQLRWSETYLASRYRVEVSKDPGFESIVFDSRSRDHTSTWKAPKPGKYYWRVLTEAPGLETPKRSVTGQFEIMDLPLPTPPVLPDEYEFDVETRRWKRKKRPNLGWFDFLIRPAFAAPKKKQKTVVIRWRSTGPKNTYLLELSKDKKFKNVFVRTRVTKPGFKWTGVKTGRFYLRVASVDKFDRQGDFSNISRIVVRPKPPKLYYPLGHIERLSDNFSKIVFRWKRSKKADYYQVELSNDKTFKTLVFSKKTNKAELFVDPIESGTYFWRVKTVLENEMASRFSRARRFEIEILPPAPKEYLVGFQWDRVGGAKQYAFQLARDVGFRDSLRKDRSSSRSQSLKLLEGIYYWKVAAIDAKGKQGPWSQVQSIEVPSGKDPFVAIAPDFVERHPAARGPKREEENKKKKQKAQKKAKKPPRIPKELYLEAGYGLLLNNYAQASNDPAATYSGLNFVNYGGKLHFWWDPHDFGLRGSYFGQIRTLFESGQVGGDQSPIRLTRHDIQGTFRYRLRPFGNIVKNELSFELGYRYMNVFTFRTLTSTSLQRVTTSTHHLLAAVGLETSLIGGLGVGARVGYSYPISHSGIVLSSPVNLFGEASVFYELFSNFLVDLTYVYQLNRFDYVDNDDTLAGGAVTGTIKDDNQFLKLSIGYRLRL